MTKIPFSELNIRTKIAKTTKKMNKMSNKKVILLQTLKLISYEELCDSIGEIEVRKLGATKELWENISRVPIRVGRIILSKIQEANNDMAICHIKQKIKIPLCALIDCNSGLHLTTKDEIEKDIYDFRYTPTDKDIDEMIGKVDIDKFIKATSFMTRDLISENVAMQYLRKWAMAKFPIYLMFNRNLSITVESEDPLDSDSFAEYKKELLNTFPHMSVFFELIPEEAIATNSLTKDDFLKEILAEHKIPYSENMKVSKLVAKMYKNPQLDVAFSRLYSKSETITEDVVSIEPVDFLTMSLNSHGWSSCHNLSGGGYRTGTISYMLDGSSTIAFRHMKKKYDYKSNSYSDRHFSWNSKRRRAVVFFDTSNCSFVMNRIYPSDNRTAPMTLSLSKAIVKMITKTNESDWSYSTDCNKSQIMSSVGGGHYADPIALIGFRNVSKDNMNVINYGNPTAICVVCHREFAVNTSPHSLYCKDCR